MKKINRFTVPAIIFLLGLSGSLRAQDAYRVADPDIKVLGTSNLHNWTMEAKDVTCSANFVFGHGGNGLPQSLTELKLVIPIHNLKSGESSMDSRAYTALKADKFGTIEFYSLRFSGYRAGSKKRVPGEEHGHDNYCRGVPAGRTDRQLPGQCGWQHYVQRVAAAENDGLPDQAAFLYAGCAENGQRADH